MNGIVAPVSLPGEVDGAEWEHLVVAAVGHLAPELRAWLRGRREGVELTLVVCARDLDGVFGDFLWSATIEREPAIGKT